MRNWKPSLRTIIALVIVSGLLLLGVISPGFYSSNGRKTKTTFSISNGKYVQLMLRMYADDHEGHMPDTLNELSPDYLPQLREWGFCYDDSEPRHYSDWLYFRRPFLDQAPPKDILLASSWGLKEAPLRAPKRVVILFDGGYELLSEDDFQARIIRESHEQPSTPATPNHALQRT